jgi:hypothetical protein
MTGTFNHFRDTILVLATRPTVAESVIWLGIVHF